MISEESVPGMLLTRWHKLDARRITRVYSGIKNQVNYVGGRAWLIDDRTSTGHVNDGDATFVVASIPTLWDASLIFVITPNCMGWHKRDEVELDATWHALERPTDA